MSQAIKPTLSQKKRIEASGLVWKNWLVLAETPAELRIVSKGTGQTRRIKKESPATANSKRFK